MSVQLVTLDILVDETAQLENRLMLRMAGLGLAGITILFSRIKFTG
jgi:hypothetical protein